MKAKRRIFAGVLACLAASAFAATTQYKFSAAGNYPGAFQTIPLAVHGNYIGGYYESGNVVSGYLEKGTKFKQINPPGALTSYISAINRSGMLVGGSCSGLCTPNTGQHGFLYTNGKYTKIDYPSGVQGTTTAAFGINDNGQVVGGYCLPPQSACPAGDTNPASHGFVDDHGVFTQLDYPGAQQTQANAINDAGTIVGTYLASLYLHSYLYENGVYTNIDVPGENWTFVSAINNQGIAAGYFQDSTLYVHGFLYQNGVFTTIDAPGATVTAITGSGDAEAIVGTWSNGFHEGNFKGIPIR